LLVVEVVALMQQAVVVLVDLEHLLVAVLYPLQAVLVTQ
jgi:hypothetical protein